MNEPDQTLNPKPFLLINKKVSKAELRARIFRQRYLIPNAVTLGNMFCGFLTIIYASSDRFEKAVIAIAVAILLDGMDGRVARKLNATSRFGVEFDSFSDLISFGVAPAMLIYHWCFRVQADEFGVFISFVYALCAASRLARFNISDPDLKSFTGLPTPGAAAVLAAIVNFQPKISPTLSVITFGAGIMLCLSFLMVSKIEFMSVKELKVGKVRFWARLAMGCGIALVWYNPNVGFLILSFGYLLSGPVLKLIRLKRKPAI